MTLNVHKTIITSHPILVIRASTPIRSSYQCDKTYLQAAPSLRIKGPPEGPLEGEETPRGRLIGRRDTAKAP